MEFKQNNLLYFSATGTTKQIVSAIAQGIGIKEQKKYEIINCSFGDISFQPDELVIIGFPVFSGRVPHIVKKAIENIKGHCTPVILVCVYGNREFDDALLEMKEMVEEKGFYVISAGAFVAQHSIFPTIAQGRPDSIDLLKAKEFGSLSIECAMQDTNIDVLKVRGNRPYRPVTRVPLFPSVKSGCIACGHCVKKCPMQAINPNNPKKIDKEKCISCAHCIAICPKQVRSFRGILYGLARRKFEKNFKERKEPYVVYRK